MMRHRTSDHGRTRGRRPCTVPGQRRLLEQQRGPKSTKGGGGVAALPAQAINATAYADVKTGGTLRLAIRQFPSQYNFNQINGPTSATVGDHERDHADAVHHQRHRPAGERPGVRQPRTRSCRPTRPTKTPAVRHPRAEPEGEVVERPADHRARLHRAVGGAERLEPEVRPGRHHRLQRHRQRGPGLEPVRGRVHLLHTVRRVALAVRHRLPGRVQRDARRVRQRLPEQDPGHRRPVQGLGHQLERADRHPGARPGLLVAAGQAGQDRLHHAQRVGRRSRRWPTTRSTTTRSSTSPSTTR